MGWVVSGCIRGGIRVVKGEIRMLKDEVKVFWDEAQRRASLSFERDTGLGCIGKVQDCAEKVVMMEGVTGEGG